MIKSTNQTFVEAGGNEVYPDLEMVGVVRCEVVNRRNAPYNQIIDELNSSIRRKASKRDYSHIFKIEYEVSIEGRSTVMGTGYKPIM